MPRLSEFRGIVISMYYKDHGLPHFHAVYAGEDVSIAIDTLEVLEAQCRTGFCDWLASGQSCTARSCSPTGSEPAARMSSKRSTRFLRFRL